METKEFNRPMKAWNNGFLHLCINFALLAATILFTVLLVVNRHDGLGATVCCVGSILWVLHLIGFMIIQPNIARVLIFFGKYRGTVTDNGFFWVNPFYSTRKLSLRARNMDVAPIKVNDKNGNKTTHDNGYDNFVNVQSDAALRKVAGMYAYDNIDHHSEELTLRSGGEEINDRLEKELRSRLDIAGIEVVEARINYLAYAAEIASVMLRRQQADAIISAREKIVEGAVSMVDLALKKLSADGIVELDEERKAAMVSNLLVVLCADESASPVINTGTLYN